MPLNAKKGFTPPQIMLIGFAIIIGFGTVLLSLPVATENQVPLATVDAFFTATSATAVTGLIVTDTQQTFSLFGEIVILIMIQIGGLGLMAVSTITALALGRKITLSQRLVMQQELGNLTLAGLVRLAKYVIGFTFLVEGLATVLLGVYWLDFYPPAKAFYYAVFHSISAFCNAGFDLFSVSLAGWTEDSFVNIIITSLFIIGGLGFTVALDVGSRRKWHKFSLHTKLVLLITSALIATGFLGVLLMEYSNPQTLGPLSLKGKLLAGYFQGVTPRTAGFNTIDISQMRQGSLFLIILLMFIGSSPGSTGGGVKTTTIGSVLLALYVLVRGKEDVNILERRLPIGTVLKALAVVTAGMGLIFVVLIILLNTEQIDFLPLLFEVTSAFATVGLSMGATAELTTVGKLVIALAMFTGRVGPLTLLYALASRQGKRAARYHYPEEDIIIG